MNKETRRRGPTPPPHDHGPASAFTGAHTGQPLRSHLPSAQPPGHGRHRHNCMTGTNRTHILTITLRYDEGMEHASRNARATRLQRTLVLLKPDAVQRNLIGHILGIFELAGLRITALQMIIPDRELAQKHYPDSDAWRASAGAKTIENYRASGVDPVEVLGTEDPIRVGSTIKARLVDYLTSGPVVAVILSGNEAVLNVRRLVGSTLPSEAPPGTIRGSFSIDSAQAANEQNRPVYNLVHASGTANEADNEISLWFPSVDTSEH